MSKVIYINTCDDCPYIDTGCSIQDFDNNVIPDECPLQELESESL